LQYLTCWGRLTEHYCDPVFCIMADGAAAAVAATPPGGDWDGNALKDAFVCLSLTDVAVREFMENGVTNVHHLHTLSAEALMQLIKQTH